MSRKFVPLRGGGRSLMAKTILNFHFDYLNPSLMSPLRPIVTDWQSLAYFPDLFFHFSLWHLSGEQGSQLDKGYTTGYSGYCLFSLLQMLYALLSHFPDLILHQNCSQQRLIFKQQDCHFCHKSKINYLPGKWLWKVSTSASLNGLEKNAN